MFIFFCPLETWFSLLNRFTFLQVADKQLVVGTMTGQFSIIPKPELRGFWKDSPTFSLPFKVTKRRLYGPYNLPRNDPDGVWSRFDASGITVQHCPGAEAKRIHPKSWVKTGCPS